MSSNSCMSVCVILILLYVVYILYLKSFKECFSEQAMIATVAQKLNMKDVMKLYEVQNEMNPLCPIGMKAGLNGDCYSTNCPTYYQYNLNTSTCTLAVLSAPNSTEPITGICGPSTKMYNGTCYQPCRVGYTLNTYGNNVYCVPSNMTNKPFSIPVQKRTQGQCGPRYMMDTAKGKCVLYQ